MEVLAKFRRCGRVLTGGWEPGTGNQVKGTVLRFGFGHRVAARVLGERWCEEIGGGG